MGLRGSSGQEIQACIDILQEAKTFGDVALRAEHARRALPQIERLKQGRMLAAAVAKDIDGDDLDHAIELLKMVRGARRHVVARRVVLLLVPFSVVLAVIVMQFGGARKEAVAAANGCWAAQEAIGQDIAQPWWGVGCGSSESSGGSGYAQWSIPVSGTDGGGTLSYTAEQGGGVWRIQHATLRVDGRFIGVVPCTGEIGDRDDARGIIDAGVSREGVVTTVSGEAPVTEGDRCSVLVLPDPDFPDSVPFNCRVLVSCDGRAIYGTTSTNGYVFCAVRDGRPVSAHDGAGSADSSDPMLDMNLAKNGVTISDDAPTRYSFSIALE